MLTQSQPRLKSTLDFIPAEVERKYQASDLEYNYCVVKFSEMQAAKRDTIPFPTMKIWFREFIKLGWNKYKFDSQFDALMKTEISGHAIRIDNWINADATKNNHQAYEKYKPLPGKRNNNGLGLRKYLDELDEKKKKERKFYIDRKTKKKVYYPELPGNWKADLISRWRQGDRIKKELRG